MTHFSLEFALFYLGWMFPTIQPRPALHHYVAVCPASLNIFLLQFQLLKFQPFLKAILKCTLSKRHPHKISIINLSCPSNEQLNYRRHTPQNHIDTDLNPNCSNNSRALGKLNFSQTLFDLQNDDENTYLAELL